MPSTTIRHGIITLTCLLSTTALANAQEAMSSDVAPAPAQAASAMPVVDAAVPGAPIQASAQTAGQEAYYRVTAPSAGTYVLAVPTTLPVRIRVDGDTVVDQTQQRNLGEQAFTRALFALDAGEHVVAVSGEGAAMRSFNDILFNKVGGLPQNFSTVAQTTDADTAAQILTAQAQAGSTTSAQPSNGQFGNGNRTPFMIGGSSSGQAGQIQPGSRPSGALGGGGGAPMQMAGLSQSNNAAGGFMSSGGGSTGGTSSGGTTTLGTGFTVGSSDGGNSSGDGGTVVAGGGTSNPTVGGGGTPTNPTPTAGGGGAPTTPTTGGGTPTVPTPTGGGTPTTPTPTPTTPTPTTPAPTTPNPNPTTPNPTPDPAPAPSGTATASPLLPPSDVTVTEAVQLVAGGTDEGAVAVSGQTLFGKVQSPEMYDTVRVDVSTSARTTNVDVGPTTGQFAVRLHPEDMTGGPVSVTLTGMLAGNTEVTTEAVTYEFTPGYTADGTVQALSRISYGATPDLYARVRAEGFAAYLEEQLSPETIDDSAFQSMNADAILNETTQSQDVMFNSLEANNLAHAIYSDRQLQEVMGAFWSNHFHAATKDSNVQRQAIVDRQYFRDNAFGTFEDLLLYSASSPLMSQFLDNDESRAGRINENYGREILELHTVGVDASDPEKVALPYGPDDVIAVSRIFTGWDWRRTNQDEENVAARHEFEFRPDRHDTEDKVIPFLETTIAGRTGADGVEEGRELIAILANHPLTQNYVCGKIVQKFVADQPPASFVESCVGAWAESGGDSREILRAILSRPDYIDAVEYQRVKGKTPFEFAASLMRALGAEPAGDHDRDYYKELTAAVASAGWVPTRFQAPTGLPEVGGAWIASAALISQYSQVVTAIANNQNKFILDFQEQILDAGLETAEEVAAYFLAIGTSDHYRGDEFDQLVDTLKGEDGIFEPAIQDESDALERAAILLAVMPSFLLQ